MNGVNVVVSLETTKTTQYLLLLFALPATWSPSSCSQFSWKLHLISYCCFLLSLVQPRYTLHLKADLENLTNLVSKEDIQWELKLRFTDSGEETPKSVYVSAQDAMDNGKDQSCNLVIRDKVSKREATLDIERKSVKPFTQDHSGKFTPVITFECRNCEPVAFFPGV